MTIPSTGPRWHQTADVHRDVPWTAVVLVVGTLGAVTAGAVAVDQRRWVELLLVVIAWELLLVLVMLVELWRAATAPQPIEQRRPGTPLPPVTTSGRGAWPWS